MIPDHVVLRLHNDRVAAAQRHDHHARALARHRSERPPDPTRLRVAVGERLVRLGERLAHPGEVVRL